MDPNRETARLSMGLRRLGVVFRSPVIYRRGVSPRRARRRPSRLYNYIGINIYRYSTVPGCFWFFFFFCLFVTVFILRYEVRIPVRRITGALVYISTLMYVDPCAPHFF